MLPSAHRLSRDVKIPKAHRGRRSLPRDLFFSKVLFSPDNIQHCCLSYEHTRNAYMSMLACAYHLDTDRGAVRRCRVQSTLLGSYLGTSTPRKAPTAENGPSATLHGVVKLDQH